MNRVLKFTISLLFTLISLNTISQETVVMEQIQSYSVLSPTANYWHLPKDIKPLLEALDTGVFQELNVTRDKNFNTKTIHLSKQNQIGKISMDWPSNTNSTLHAYLEIYEMNPAWMYQNRLAQIPESKKDSIKSIWVISCHIFNHRKENIFKKTILLSMWPTKTVGMGYAVELPSTTSGFVFNALQKGVALLSTNLDDLEYIEAKVPSAYYKDNAWMPFLQQQVRVKFDTSKDYITYQNWEGIHLLRTMPAEMNKISQKDKSDNNPYYAILPMIKKRQGSGVNEYYQVVQSFRDVNNDQEYQMEAYLEFNLSSSDQMISESPIHFLPGDVHTIFLNQDSIGYFNVQENVTEKDKFFNLNEIFNGFDSTKMYHLGTFYEKRKIISSKVITGIMKVHPFRITINYANQLKSIYINDELVIVAEGKNKPIQMVESKMENEMAIQNFLLQLAFSEVFQLPVEPN